MKITLAVLFLAALTIYCKCAAVLSLPPSLIAHAAFLDGKIPNLPTNKDNEKKEQQHLVDNEDEVLKKPALAADLYTNLKNLWQNDLSLNLQKREQRNTFDDDIVNVAAMQKQQHQPMAAIKKNNLNQNAPQPHDNNNDNTGHKIPSNDNNHNNNNNKNENNILKSSFETSLPLSLSSAATHLNMQQQNVAPLVDNFDSSDWLSYDSPEMIDDIFVSTLPHQQLQGSSTFQLKRKELENMPEDSTILNRLLKPTKYWSRLCPLENENNCLQEYYGALIADRNNALLKQFQYQQNHPFAAKNQKSFALDPPNDIIDDDIVMLLTAEQNLIKFLSWALGELYPYGKFSNKTNYEGADSYHPGMYMWKKLNLSGRLEPPLLVEEPKYVIVRREFDQIDDNDYKRGLNYGGDPFIPPRGRKHNLPDLDSLLHRYETFVPNRGRRDKIKDIFKYDDLFYPNRGKRQMIATTTTDDNGGDIDERNDDDDDINDNKYIAENQYYNNQNEQHEMPHPLLSNDFEEYVENLMAKIKRKLQQTNQDHEHDYENNDGDEKLVNNFDEMSNRNEPTRKMSTTYQTAAEAATPAAASSLLKKRFKTTINILHNRQQQQKQRHQQHLPNHYNARRQLWKRYATTASKASSTRSTNMPIIRSPTLATNRLQTTLRSMSPLQQLTQLYEQQQQSTDLSPPRIIKSNNKFMWQQQQHQNSLKSLPQHFDPLSWHKLQLLLQQQHHYHLPLLTMRHPRLTALQHLPSIQQLATPQETQLTYSNHDDDDQLDNGIPNDIYNFYNKDLD